MIKKVLSLNTLTDIRFWIILFFFIRLIGITNPPIEMGHSWRQITNYMVQRNFQETDNTILFPRVDDTKGGSGIIGMEFPVLNYTAYVLSEIFGYQHTWGRLINLLISSLGLFYFFKIFNSMFNPKTAFYSTLLLRFSVWFPYSRKFMSDTFCISLAFIAIYQCILFFKSGKVIYLLMFFLLSTLASLSKIPAIVYFSLLPLCFYYIKGETRSKIMLLLSSSFTAVIVYYWYFIWCSKIAEQSGMWYNAGTGFATGFHEIKNNLYDAFEKFYFCSFSSFIILLIFIIGLVTAIKKRQKVLLLILTLMGVVFGAYILKSGYFFASQSYYIIPFVPVMALIGGSFLASIENRKVLLAFIIFGSIESVANQYHDFFNPESELYKLRLEKIVDKWIAKDQLVAVNGGMNPQLLYFTHRKGWTFEQREVDMEKFLNELESNNCRYIISDKHINDYANLPKDFLRLYEDTDFIILQNSRK